MAKLLISTLVLFATAYTFFIVWMVWFTFAFGGADLTGASVLVVGAFCLVALSPIPVCLYCFRRVRSVLRGERPRI